MTRDGRVALWWWVTLGLGVGIVVAAGTSRWPVASALLLVDALAYWRFGAAVRERSR